VERVVDLVKKEGVMAAYQKVQLKLSEPKALGYSSAGTVIAVGPGCGDYFKIGDRVSCAGQGVASHAEIVCVPTNLAARIPEGVDFESAAFTTIGAIALHGVRQGRPLLAERWAVIGLGLVGQLSVQLLKAHGARVAAFDLDDDLVTRARDRGAEIGVSGGTSDQVAAAMAWTEGLGVDGVLVCAASSSDAPMISAAGMARDRAVIVAVGFVPHGLPRDVAFAKELELKISRSYGPGRYDSDYEQKNFDYPAGYVRWTETRNMEAFLHTLSTGQVTTGDLVTHRLPVVEAPAAYDQLLSGEGEKPLGMVLTYPETDTPEPLIRPSASRPASGPIQGRIGVAFIGAGSFSRGTLLPRFARNSDVRMRRVVTARGLSAFDAARRFGFDEAGSNADAVFSDPDVHLVCVTTRHDMHADLVMRALKAGKHVFVEKPLCLNEAQLQEIEAVAADSPGQVLVGFNRRFSPMAVALREAVKNRGPVLATYRVNAGRLNGHWLQDPEFGGGRIIGEGCHFVDLLSFMAGDADIATIEAQCAGRPKGLAEDVVAQLRFTDGSVGQLIYTAVGNASMGKERVEVFAGGVSGYIDDYNDAAIWRGQKSEKVKETGKGHSEEVDVLIEALKKGAPSPIPFEVLARITRATFMIHERVHGA
jgi:predicted dehydrogenase/threonine dehydrogenase-like Zn-dependent dehydrogenase